MKLLRAWNVSTHLRSSLIALVTLASPIAAQTQQATVTGRVIAAGTNAPLSDSRVVVVNSSLSTLTGADGRYTLRGVPTGNIEIRVLRVGYQEQKKAVAVAPGASATVDFTMAQAIVQLQE